MRKGKARIDYFKKIGLSDYVIRIAKGKILHDLLDT